jgi:tripartite-type tricarboxylate transporter receptor subunit TctC
MKPFSSLLVAATAAGALTLGALSAPATAADFSGQRIEFVIPFGTGGGTDGWARFFAPRFQAALPGNPVVVVRNVPGGGGITGTNQFAERARPDGLTVLGTSGSVQFPYLLGDSRARYDYGDWTVVLVTPTGGVIYAQPGLGVGSAAEIGKLRGQDLMYGSAGVTALDLVMSLSFDLLDIDLKPVFGMKSRGQARLAFERHEATLDWQTTAAYLRNVTPLVQQGRAVPLFAYGTFDEQGNLARDPTFPDLPHFGEVYRMVHGRDPSGPAWDAWVAFFTAGFAAQKMIVVPRATPADTVAAWRRAAEAVVNAPGFAEAAEKALGEVEQGVGQRAETLYRLATQVDPEARAWVREWLNRKFDAKL